MKKYFCCFRMGMKSAYEYRLNFIFVLFSAFFPMIIQTFLWIAIFDNSQKPNSIWIHIKPNDFVYNPLTNDCKIFKNRSGK